MAREFDFDNCTIDTILEFSEKNYLNHKEEYDEKKKSLLQQNSVKENAEPKIHKGECTINC